MLDTFKNEQTADHFILITSFVTGVCEKFVFLYSKACEPFLKDTQNKGINVTMNITWDL